MLGLAIASALTDEPQLPPLHTAARAGDCAAARALIDAGAAPDALAPGALTPLLLAASAGHSELVALLIARGARVNHQRADGTTPLCAAAAGAPSAGRVECARRWRYDGAQVPDPQRRDV